MSLTSFFWDGQITNLVYFRLPPHSSGSSSKFQVRIVRVLSKRDSKVIQTLHSMKKIDQVYRSVDLSEFAEGCVLDFPPPPHKLVIQLSRRCERGRREGAAVKALVVLPLAHLFQELRLMATGAATPTHTASSGGEQFVFDK